MHAISKQYDEENLGFDVPIATFNILDLALARKTVNTRRIDPFYEATY